MGDGDDDDQKMKKMADENKKPSLKLFGVDIGKDPVPTAGNDDDQKIKRMAADRENPSTGGGGDDEDGAAKKKRQKEIKGKEKMEGMEDDGVKVLVGDMGKEKKEEEEREKVVNSSERKKSKKQKKKPTFGVVPPCFHPDILGEIIIHVEQDTPPVLLLRKKLEFGDVDASLNRLSIGELSWQLMGRILGGKLRKRVERREQVFRVITTDVKAHKRTLELVRSISSTAAPAAAAAAADQYLLQYQWNDVVAANGLHQGDTVEGWGYRRDRDIYIALIVFKRPI